MIYEHHIVDHIFAQQGTSLAPFIYGFWGNILFYHRVYDVSHD